MDRGSVQSPLSVEPTAVDIVDKNPLTLIECCALNRRPEPTVPHSFPSSFILSSFASFLRY